MSVDVAPWLVRTVVKAFVAGWLVLMAAAAFLLPAYRGEIGIAPRAVAVLAFAVLAALALVAVRGRAPSRTRAAVSALPALGLLALAVVVGDPLDTTAPRGEPIFLFFGIALWASWAALVLATALAARAKWSGIGALAVTVVVAKLGLFLVAWYVD